MQNQRHTQEMRHDAEKHNQDLRQDQERHQMELEFMKAKADAERESRRQANVQA